MPDKIRVAVCDDHPMLREGVVRTLEDAGNIEVVGQGGSADDALRLAEQELPDVMVIDINMPGSGLTALKGIAAAFPAVKVVMLTVMQDESDVSGALEMGARGYVLKGVSGPELISVVRTVHEGGSYVSPSLAAKLLADARRQREQGRQVDPRDVLTAREEQILALVGKGMSNKEIGLELDIKEKTVKHYMTNILQKLQARNRVEAALLARDRQS